MEEKASARAVISGRVQGVFFRMETHRTAKQHHVNGWVKNKRDGTVEAVFEGDKGDVEAVLAWCKKGPPSSRVDQVKVDWEPYSGSFSGFDIRY